MVIHRGRVLTPLCVVSAGQRSELDPDPAQ